MNYIAFVVFASLVMSASPSRADKAYGADKNGPKPDKGFSGEKPEVIFFGGFGATKADMKTWTDGVNEECKDEKSVELATYPFPGADQGSTIGSGDGVADKSDEGKKMIAEVVNKIKSSKKDFIVAAHSSGTTLLTAALEQLDPNDAKHVKIVMLDGFALKSSIKGKFKDSLCYGGYGDSCDHVESVPNDGCGAGAAMCPHFQLVNAGVRKAQSGVAGGYNGFKAQTSWIKKSGACGGDEKNENAPKKAGKSPLVS